MQQSSPISVLIVDEHPVTRWGLSRFLETYKNLSIVGEASSIEEMFEQVRLHNPDIVLMDTLIPGGDAIQATRDLIASGSKRVLAFTARDSWEHVERFLDAGGLGFVPKRCPPDELLQALSAVADHRQWISPSMRHKAGTLRRDAGSSRPVLSPREQEVAVLVARGLTSRQIADQLCVSLKTVETHRYRIFKDLGIENRAELVNYVIENGLLHGSENKS